MRCLSILLFAGAAVAPLAACGAEPPPSPSSAPAPAPSAPAPAPSATPSGATPSTSSAPAPVPSVTVSGTSPGAATSPPGPGEVPGELPHGNRTLTGVVEQSGDCTLLRVGDRRWVLTGTPVETLTTGDRVTVAGQLTTTDAGCTGPDIARTLIVHRVTPG